MKQVLHLGAAGDQVWRHDGKGWQAVAAADATHSLWVLADLPEESFSEVRMPRLFGRDRAAFIARQLSSAFPETPYRGFLTPPQDDAFGSLLPTRQLLFGINAAERLDQAIAASAAPVAGVWPVSLLLARLCRRKNLPRNLVVALPGPESLRIVYLRNGTPLLTRLTGMPEAAEAQVEQVVRTLGYLEKNQTLPQPRQGHPILFLGGGGAVREALYAAGLSPVESPVRRGRPAVSLHALFDLVVGSPEGQLAPLPRRTRHLGRALDRQSRTAALAVAATGVLALGSSAIAVVAEMQERRPLQERRAQLDAQVAALDRQIARYNAPPDLVRRVIALDGKQIASIPQLADHLRLVSAALAGDARQRLRQLRWRLLQPGELPCGIAGDAANPNAEAEAQADPATQTRRVELGFDLALPESYGPRERAQRLGQMSARLGAIAGATVWKDASRIYAGGSLSGGTMPPAGSAYAWCLTLPGEPAAETDPAQADARGGAL